MRTSDEELMMKCRNGDMSAFELIVMRYKDLITNFIYRSIGDYHRAEDLAQETFLRVFRSANRYEPQNVNSKIGCILSQRTCAGTKFVTGNGGISHISTILCLTMKIPAILS